MSVKLTTENARRSALTLKETTHASVLRALCHWCVSYFFSPAYFSFYRVICDIPWRRLIHHTQSSYLTHKMQTVFFSGGGLFFVSKLFCFFRCERRGLVSNLTAQVKHGVPLSLSLSSLFSCSYFLFACHRWVFWWDKPVWQSRELPQHSW